MPARKYPDALVNEAARLREAGITIPEIATRLGMPRSVVEYHCQKLGADDPGAAHRSEPVYTTMEYTRGGRVVRRFSEAEDVLLLRLEAEGLSIGVIARRMNRRHNSVTQRLRMLARRDTRREARQVQDAATRVFATDQAPGAQIAMEGGG